MGKLTDMQIRAWVKSGERFEGRPSRTMYCVGQSGFSILRSSVTLSRPILPVRLIHPTLEGKK